MCLSKGQAKATYGTGCFVLYNTGDIRVSSSRGLLTTVAYQLGSDNAPCYALEGSVSYLFFFDKLYKISFFGSRLINVLLHKYSPTYRKVDAILHISIRFIYG